MAHFAQLDENNMVIQVIVVNNDVLLDDNNEESEEKGIEFCNTLYDGKWVQTSYNGNCRKHYAGIGFYYDKEKDAFIPPSPHDSWILDDETCTWQAPIPMPDLSENFYATWDESKIEWAIHELSDGRLFK